MKYNFTLKQQLNTFVEDRSEKGNMITYVNNMATYNVEMYFKGLLSKHEIIAFCLKNGFYPHIPIHISEANCVAKQTIPGNLPHPKSRSDEEILETLKDKLNYHCYEFDKVTEERINFLLLQIEEKLKMEAPKKEGLSKSAYDVEDLDFFFTGCCPDQAS